jgi:hypothetical protein
MGTFLEFAGILLGAATAGTFCSLLWYRVTQRNPHDKLTAIFFVKLVVGTVGTFLASVRRRMTQEEPLR